jgi:hypothetical protein
VLTVRAAVFGVQIVSISRRDRSRLKEGGQVDFLPNSDLLLNSLVDLPCHSCQLCSAETLSEGESQFENKYFTEMGSGSVVGSCLRLIDFVQHSTLGVGVIHKKKENLD